MISSNYLNAYRFKKNIWNFREENNLCVNLEVLYFLNLCPIFSLWQLSENKTICFWYPLVRNSTTHLTLIGTNGHFFLLNQTNSEFTLFSNQINISWRNEKPKKLTRDESLSILVSSRIGATLLPDIGFKIDFPISMPEVFLSSARLILKVPSMFLPNNFNHQIYSSDLPILFMVRDFF